MKYRNSGHWTDCNFVFIHIYINIYIIKWTYSRTCSENNNFNIHINNTDVCWS